MGNQVCTLLLLYDNGEKTVTNRCITFCVLLWMLQNTPHEVYVYISCAPKLYLAYARTFALYGVDDAPKQDACYCEFYRAVDFVVHDTVTIPYLTVVLIRSSTNWGHKSLL